MDIKTIFQQFKAFLEERFDLSSEKENDLVTIETIRRGVEFKGTSLWVLIFAIFIASLGLNVNSAAVIIGAMLISPLMGPIMGVGLGLGINDWELTKKSIRNLVIATLISLITATIYFLISPYNEARSELLARTSPTVYDILIAFFGGMAGIVAGASKERGNVIPGVAIATALMPPLCTAGYGLATGNAAFFFGAFYLYCINSVFISLATYFGARIMKFPHKEFMDAERGKRVKRSVTTVVILTIIPSIWISYNMIKESYLQVRVNNYVNQEIAVGNRQVISKTVDFSGSNPEISVALFGDEVTEQEETILMQKLDSYGLKECKLIISQGGGNSDISSIKELVLEDFYKRSETQLKEKQIQVELLTEKLKQTESINQIAGDLSRELSVLYPTVTSVALSRLVEHYTQNSSADTVVVALIKSTGEITDRERMSQWLSARMNEKEVRLIIDNE